MKEKLKQNIIEDIGTVLGVTEESIVKVRLFNLKNAMEQTEAKLSEVDFEGKKELIEDINKTTLSSFIDDSVYISNLRKLIKNIENNMKKLDDDFVFQMSGNIGIDKVLEYQKNTCKHFEYFNSMFPIMRDYFSVRLKEYKELI